MSKWNEGGGEPPKIETRTPEAPRAVPKEKPTETPVTEASKPKTPKEIVSAPNAEKVASTIEPERLPSPAETTKKSNNQNETTSGKQDNRYLDVKYDSQLKKMEDGTFRMEKSAEATLLRDDPKTNSRHDPTEKSNDQKVRAATRLPGQDATHLVSAQDGAKSDERNIVPFNPVMNRRFQQEHDRQQRNTAKEEGEVMIRPTSIHRAQSDGTFENRPIAIRLSEGKVGSDGGKRGELLMGNFSSHTERLYEKMPEGQKPTRDEVNQAYRQDSALYSENKRKSEQVKPPSPGETSKKLAEKEPGGTPGPVKTPL